MQFDQRCVACPQEEFPPQQEHLEVLDCSDDRVHLQFVYRVVALRAAQRPAEESYRVFESGVIELLL